LDRKNVKKQSIQRTKKPFPQPPPAGGGGGGEGVSTNMIRKKKREEEKKKKDHQFFNSGEKPEVRELEKLN